MIRKYRYDALAGQDSIRLLRLLPSKNKTAPLRCHILHSSLDEMTAQPIYQALSYVWGSPKKTHFISLDAQCHLDITSNLFNALLHLRYPIFERIIWVDGICINQEDKKEKDQQIQLMYKIYAHANSVIVWLGVEADDSDQALRQLLAIAQRKTTDPEYEATTDSEYEVANKSQNGAAIDERVIKLLQRDWFQRIWVLQEVAAARRIHVLCGHSAIDGHLFCLAMGSLTVSSQDSTGFRKLKRTIEPITHLMKGAICRPSHQIQDTVSEGISPIGELLDMFCAHKASELSDKIYALLGMSTNDMSKSNLLPDYTVPFGELFKRAIQFILSDKINIETRNNMEAAVLNGKAQILGVISSAGHPVPDNKQQVRVHWRDLCGPQNPTNLPEEMSWTIQSSAIPLEPGDCVCLLHGATKPTIIRACVDFSIILLITATPPAPMVRSGILQKANIPVRQLTLVWDWKSSTKDFMQQGSYEDWAHSNNWAATTADGDLDRALRLWNCALLLMDVQNSKGAEKRFQKAMALFENELQGWQTPRSERNLLNMLQKKGNAYGMIPELLFLKNDMDRRKIQSQYPLAPFSWAIEGGHNTLRKLLLDFGRIDTNTEDKYGEFPIQLASKGGHLDIVERLLQEKADVNARDEYGSTALQAAAGGGYLAVVERLLQEKADVNAQDEDGSTALQAAAGGGYLAVVERLLQEKADVNAQDEGGSTALQAAAGGGHLAIVERLLQEKADVNAPAGTFGATALQAAAGGGHLAVVERLLQEKADVNAQDEDESTALQAAAGGGHLDIVELLLEKKAYVNAAAKILGETALQAAARGGHAAIVERLLQEKADVNVAAEIGRATALQAAAGGGHLDIVEWLLQEKADVNAPAGRYGETALQAAARGGHAAIVERLRQAGAY